MYRGWNASNKRESSSSDGGLTDTIAVTVDITDVDEVPDPPSTPESTNTAPVFVEGETTTRVVPENTVVGFNIGNPVSATDVEGDSLTYTLRGIDADAFEHDSDQLKTEAVLDYETKTHLYGNTHRQSRRTL